MTLVDAMTYAIRNEGLEIVGQRRFVYYLNDLRAFDMTPAARRILTVIIDQGYGRKLIFLTESSFLRQVKINEIKTQIVNYEGFQAELVDAVVDSICIALRLIITDENKRAIGLLVASLQQNATRNIATIVGGLYNSSVILEANLLQQIFINRFLAEKRIEAEIREREEAKKALGTLIGDLQLYATQSIANIMGALYSSSVTPETNILQVLSKKEIPVAYIDTNEEQIELKGKYISEIISALQLYVQNIEKENNNVNEVTEVTEETEDIQVHEIESSYNTIEEESVLLDVTDDTQKYITVSLEDALESYNTDIPVLPDILKEVTESEINDNDSHLSEVQVKEPEGHKKESSRKRSLLRSLLSIFRQD